jgi:hypothetical protein
LRGDAGGCSTRGSPRGGCRVVPDLRDPMSPRAAREGPDTRSPYGPSKLGGASPLAAEHCVHVLNEPHGATELRRRVLPSRLIAARQSGTFLSLSTRRRAQLPELADVEGLRHSPIQPARSLGRHPQPGSRAD